MLKKLEENSVRLEELNQKLSDPEIIADTKLWRELAKEHATIAEIDEKYKEFLLILKSEQDALELIDLGDEDMLELAKLELDEARTKKEALENELKALLAPRDPSDDKNVVLEIRAGTGGEEAALFAADLLKMYQRFCEKKGWNMEITNSSDTDISGVKEVVCLVTGKEAFRHLKFESGTHRVQRVPVTESGGRIHTSAATVAVLPEADDIDITIDPNDLIIETHRSSGAGGQHVNKTESAVHIIHVPTQIVVDCQDERSQIKNREKAMKILKSRVYDYYKTRADKEYAQKRSQQIGSGDRSERIRTYNFPQGRVTDHRIGLTLYKLDAFLAGELDEMINALILAQSTGQMQNDQGDNI